jgi:endoglucanase
VNPRHRSAGPGGTKPQQRLASRLRPRRPLWSSPALLAGAVLVVAAATITLGWPGLARNSAAHTSEAHRSAPLTAPSHQAAALSSGGHASAQSAAAAPTPQAAPAATPRTATAPDAGIAFPLHTSGASIVDAKGKPVHLNLVNWYGAESPDFVVGGLKYQPVAAIINEIVAMGFNGVRLPWSNQLWQSNPVVSDNVLTANPQFEGEHARTILGQVVQDLAHAGLMVILDDHNSNAEWCCSSSDGNTLWYNAAYPQSAWLSDWKAVATQFKATPQVIGVDLRNEPRGAATWGGSASTDWHAAAELGGDAVQSVDPKLLVFVEGTNYATDLADAGNLPVKLNVASHLVYSVHDYGFDTTVTSYDDWVSKIQSNWGYLVGKVPLWVGEFGTCNTSDTCVASNSPADLGKWFAIFTRYLRYHNLNWSYWAVNGTKSDGAPGQNLTYGETETYGVLNPKWAAAASASLLSSLQAIQPACPAGPLASGTYYIKNRHSGDVIDIPQFKSAQGTDLDQWPGNGGINQKWKVTSLGCGLYSIKSTMDGESLDIAGQSTANGAKVDQYGYWGGGNQQFIVAKNAAGCYTISSINSLDPVEVPGSSTKAGTLLDQSAASGGLNQQWTFSAA